jgi:hypothetical protein
MRLCFLFLTTLFTSCSTLTPGIRPIESKFTYSFTDVSGQYSLTRETKTVKNRLVTRAQLTSKDSSKALEKSITVSQIGSIKGEKKSRSVVRPMASDFSVWLEGKKYSSFMRLNAGNKSMSLKLESPDAQWRGDSEVKFPPGKYFCFFSQIPECLYHNQYLQQAHSNPNAALDFYIVWDSYPYMQEQFTGLRINLFAPAILKFEGELKKRLLYMVEVEGQIILYHFSKSYDLVKMAWIAQGITVVPLGEETSNEDE